MFDFIIFVPIHPFRFFIRGFNQAAFFANEIAKSCDAIVIYDVLQKVRNNKSQSLLSQKQRLKNIKGVFKINHSYKSLMSGKKVLLIDDVCTSGATISECMKELRKLSPEKIRVITLAKTKSYL